MSDKRIRKSEKGHEDDANRGVRGRRVLVIVLDDKTRVAMDFQRGVGTVDFPQTGWRYRNPNYGASI